MTIIAGGLVVFVQRTAPSVVVCAVKFALSLQEFMVISIPFFIDVGLVKWYIFYITLLKSIYMQGYEIYNIYEICVW